MPAAVAAPMTIYSTPWCGYCHRLMKQLDREGVGYEVVDIEQEPAAAEYVMSVNGGNQTVPDRGLRRRQRDDQPEPRDRSRSGSPRRRAQSQAGACDVARVGEDGGQPAAPESAAGRAASPAPESSRPCPPCPAPATRPIDAVLSTAATLLGMEVVFIGGLTDETFTFEKVHATR